MNLVQRFRFYIAGLLAICLFLGGWFGHKKFTKPVERVVTIKVPVVVDGGPTRPEVVKPGGTVTPGVHYNGGADLPKPPDPEPGFDPAWVTTVEVPVHKPVKVYYSNDFTLASQTDEKIKVRLDSRIWARYEDGTAVQGLHADTAFSVDKEFTLPVRAKVSIPAPRPWAIGAKYNLNNKEWGAWAERDIEFLRIGVDVDFTRLQGTQAWLRAGFRF